MTNQPKIIAIFIALNAKKTLTEVFNGLPKKIINEIILVDDCSDDGTFNLAKKLGITSFRNKSRLGYGGNIKKALKLALSKGADVIIDLHPDGEYKPTAIPQALKKIQQEKADLVLGNRFTKKTWPSDSGMYFWKVAPIRLLNFIDRWVLGVNISDFHQGFRLYTKKLLNNINFQNNSNDYLFSFELIAQAAFKNFRIMEVPVETSYAGKKRGASLKNSVRYSLGTFKILVLYTLAKIGFKTSLFN